MSQIRAIRPEEAEAASDAVYLDCREPGEFAGRRWKGSVNAPLSRFEEAVAGLSRSRPVVVLCQSGRRSRDAAERLAALGFTDVRVVEGGLGGCPEGCLERGPGGVWSMERQVRFAAGALVVAGVALGRAAHPGFFLLSAGVGGGLIYSAVTDTCGMTAVLALLPWNRRG